MNDFFQKLNQALIRAGVRGHAARILEQELRDHYLTEKAALLREGQSDETAEQLALAKLGDPVQLAQQARQELGHRAESLKRPLLLFLIPLGLYIFAAIVPVREARLNDRAEVRSQIDAARAAYAQGGIGAVQRMIDAESDSEQASGFLEILNANKLTFSHFPNAQRTKEMTILRPLADSTHTIRSNWVTLPSADQHKKWTIGRIVLPDGAVLYAGRELENRYDWLRPFQTVFLLALLPLIIFGFVRLVRVSFLRIRTWAVLASFATASPSAKSTF